MPFNPQDAGWFASKSNPSQCVDVSLKEQCGASQTSCEHTDHGTGVDCLISTSNQGKCTTLEDKAARKNCICVSTCEDGYDYDWAKGSELSYEGTSIRLTNICIACNKHLVPCLVVSPDASRLRCADDYSSGSRQQRRWLQGHVGGHFLRRRVTGLCRPGNRQLSRCLPLAATKWSVVQERRCHSLWHLHLQVGLQRWL